VGIFFIGIYPRSSAANWFEILGSGRTSQIGREWTRSAPG